LPILSHLEPGGFVLITPSLRRLFSAFLRLSAVFVPDCRHGYFASALLEPRLSRAKEERINMGGDYYFLLL
jgi:hypothetical protein